MRTVLTSLLMSVRGIVSGAAKQTWKKGIALVMVALLSTSCSSAFLAETETNPWEVIALPTEAAISDVAFAKGGEHGWLVGSRTTLLESTDAG
ncbi:MAG: YCF48-related protein, partial [Cyanobacteria bacterium J06649_4]